MLQTFRKLDLYSVKNNYKIRFVYHQRKQYSQHRCAVDMLDTLPTFLEPYYHLLLFVLLLQTSLEKKGKQIKEKNIYKSL